MIRRAILMSLTIGFAVSVGACSSAEGQGGQAGDPVGTASEALLGDDGLRVSTASTGTISIFNDAAFADFFAGDTVIRMPGFDECVARVRNGSTGDSPAGTMTIAGSFVGQPGGSPVPITVDPDPTSGNSYAVFMNAPPFIFLDGTAGTVTVQTTGSSTHPAMPLTTLRTVDKTFVQVIEPVVPSSGYLTIPSTRPLVVRWQPDAHELRNKMTISLWFIAGPQNVGEVRCGFDLGMGFGILPTQLLRAVKQRVSPSADVGSLLRILAGDRAEVTKGGVSYVIEVGAPFSTNISDVWTVVQ